MKQPKYGLDVQAPTIIVFLITSLFIYPAIGLTTSYFPWQNARIVLLVVSFPSNLGFHYLYIVKQCKAFFLYKSDNGILFSFSLYAVKVCRGLG